MASGTTSQVSDWQTVDHPAVNDWQDATPPAKGSASTAPGFWGTLGNDISGIPHMIANVGRLSGIGQTQDSFNQAFHELADPNINLVKQGYSELTPKTWLGGVVHMGEGLTPGVGPMTHQAALDAEQGHYGAMGARMLEIGGPRLLHGTLPLLPDELPAPLAKAAAVTKGAGKGAWEGASAGVPVNLKRFGVGVKFAAPAPLVGAGLGADAGALLGLPFGMAKPGAAIGAVAGTVAPIVRGAINGSRTALADFNDAAAAAQEMPRPDYSDLLTMPGAGIPPYQSSVIPEPGSVARKTSARPVVTRSPELPPAPPPRPSVVVDWLGRPVTPETAPVPSPESFVSTSGSRLVEPWKPTVTVNVDSPGGVKKIQIPADAITTPPAAQPPSARAVALTNKGKPVATPTFAPVGASAPSQAELFQPPVPVATQPQASTAPPPVTAAPPPVTAAPPPVATAPAQGGLLQNLMKTVQGSPDKNAETIAEHAGNIGHQLTTNKNAVIAQHLLGQGLDAGKWDALSMDEKNAWVKKVNAAQKTKYKPFGADFGPGRYGRPAEEGVRQVSDALRVLGAQPPQ